MKLIPTIGLTLLPWVIVAAAVVTEKQDPQPIICTDYDQSCLYGGRDPDPRTPMTFCPEDGVWSTQYHPCPGNVVGPYG